MARLTKAQVQSVVDEHGFTAENTAGLLDEDQIDMANKILFNRVIDETLHDVEWAEKLCDAMADHVINEL